MLIMSRVRLSVLTGVAGLAALSGCMGDPLPMQSPDFLVASYPNWRAEDATYRFYPGDKFRIDVRTAPELSGEMTIAPDGRISLPTIGPVMAGGHTVRELKTAIEEIDKTIDHLQKTKEALLGSENNLRLANNKAEDLSIKKLTRPRNL